MNFNGVSAPSTEFHFNTCVAPFGMKAPYRIDEGSTTNNLIIGWQEPVDNGGCPIRGYAVYRDNADNSDVTI